MDPMYLHYVLMTIKYIIAFGESHSYKDSLDTRQPQAHGKMVLQDDISLFYFISLFHFLPSSYV